MTQSTDQEVPIKVEVTNLSPAPVVKKAVRATAQTFTIGQQPVQIVGPAQSRVKVTLINGDTDDTVGKLCFICTTSADAQAPGNPQGAAFNAGQVVQLTTTDSLWAICPAGNATTLGVIEEFEVN